MAAPKLPGELSWPKLLGTSLAAVLAAWLAGYLGLGNTLTGVAIGSIIATFSTAFFTTTIAKTHEVLPTVLVRTDRGTVIETPADRDVAVEDDQPDPMSAMPDTETSSRWSRIHWKSVAIASLITMAITLGAISIYEGAVGRTWGSNEPGTTIGNTVRGGPQTPPAPEPTPTEAPSEEPTEEPSDEPSESPTPSADPSESPTPTPTPTDCPTATPLPGEPSPEATDPDCPTPTPTASQDGGLLR
ncbi:MAG TPA: hypothetical protein VJ782_00815 [Aeromicrobium sp.]|nr:hypothetical protein [Aeromicrobium sp.]